MGNYDSELGPYEGQRATVHAVGIDDPIEGTLQRGMVGLYSVSGQSGSLILIPGEPATIEIGPIRIDLLNLQL